MFHHKFTSFYPVLFGKSLINNFIHFFIFSTVEIRRRTDDGDCHCRAELKREEPEEKRILYGERELLLQKNQVLSIDKVYEIACKYLDQELQEDYFWRELDL